MLHHNAESTDNDQPRPSTVTGISTQLLHPRRLGTTLLLITTLLILALTGCDSKDDPEPTQQAPTEAPTAAPTFEETITLGVISGEPSKEIRDRQGFVDYMAANLAEFGIKVGEVKVTPDMALMAEWLANGEVDMMMDSFYPAAIVSDLSGASADIYRQRDRDDKWSVFFAHVDSGITSFEELPGHIIVLEEPDSTSGFLLPMFYLLEAGMTPVEKSAPDAVVEPDEVGYVFSGDDDAVVQWVLAGRATAGAAQDNNFEDFSEENPDSMVMLLETEPIIRDQPVLVSELVDPEMRQAINELMIGLGDTDEGLVLLEELNTARFAELSPERQVDVDRAQEMFDLLHNQ